MNADAQLQQSLQAQYDALVAKRDTITGDPQLDAATRTQMIALLHRIDLLADLRLSAITGELQGALAAVGAADAELTRDLAGIAEAAAMVKSVSAYLASVDSAIEVMKRLAIV
jgi:hypothetical protein